MSTSTATAPSVKPTSTRGRSPRGGCTIGGRYYRPGCYLPNVEIKAASYIVQPIDAGECGTSAVRLVKRTSGESYDLIRTHAHGLGCSCPDFVFRHEGKGSVCKHLAHAVALGLLPVAPVAPIVEAGPAPTWDAERYEPDPIEAAWWAGFQLGQEGEYPGPPATMGERARHFFNCGRLAGFIESPDGKAWYADLEAGRDREPEPGCAWHDAEGIRAIGCIEARKQQSY
jgi:hypothetical protein